ncbi:YhcN/YlaJ family sporulation lipoprotein [Brevibacillus reuszeri]|uniref:YhcN/YlaJ family sporulation lipoprotein n=1 Tax=Brevibacillus reuszeri TaxID=54915 RepID=UPI00289923A4|nr:YhcN/YlaJ family sporulation lipoprotein [Brevibacillus reuszeri]
MRTILVVLSVALLMTGCSSKSDSKAKTQSKEAEPLCAPAPVRYEQWEEQAKAIAGQVKGIDQVIAVQIDKDLDVAVKVTNFNRFRLESIQKEVSKRLKEAFPESDVHVTADKRLIRDLQKFSENPWPMDVKEACKQKKQFKQFEKKMKG